jgi:N utilization substance protein A
MSLVYDMEIIRLITLFENITGCTVRDCILEDNVIYYIVDEGKLGLAIGKNGSSVKNAERIIRKKIKVFEYDSDPVNFVKKIIPQTKEIELTENNGKKVIKIKVPKKDKPFVIGRGGKNIKVYRKILKRNHKIYDIEVR